MGIRYETAPDIEKTARFVAERIGMSHLDFKRIGFLRSYGSTSRAIARCYGLSKVWQKAFKLKSHYVVEVVSERFDRLSEEEKIKTVIHELMHIPKCFGGGFRHHDFVCEANVEKLYRKYFS
ncbi:MAG: metallopeptidase [Candidatus Aenigmarchaeota archaeon]|nr:metallopeptidase [Candidatus Aenigmarchaeota archaeon]